MTTIPTQVADITPTNNNVMMNSDSRVLHFISCFSHLGGVTYSRMDSEAGQGTVATLVITYTVYEIMGISTQCASLSKYLRVWGISRNRPPFVLLEYYSMKDNVRDWIF
jgi:hypothetical protein